MVDWLKHAFITKFNHIRPSVYERYIDVLCRDLASGSVVGRHGARKVRVSDSRFQRRSRHAIQHAYVDQSPLVARRLGFASVPLAVLAIIIALQSFNPVFSRHWRDQRDLYPSAKWIATGMSFWLWYVNLFTSDIILIVGYVSFLALKVLLGVNLISYAGIRRTGMEARTAADRVNDFGRDPIGEGIDERKYNKQLQKMIDNWRDDAVYVSEIGEGRGNKLETTENGNGKSRVPLEDLTRFTMVKRIW